MDSNPQYRLSGLQNGRFNPPDYRGFVGFETLMIARIGPQDPQDRVLMAHRTCAARNNLSNSPRRPEREGLLPVTRRGPFDQGRGPARVSLVLEAESPSIFGPLPAPS